MSNALYIEIDEKTLRGIVRDYLRERLGSLPLDLALLRIEVKSKQNYKSE